MTHVVAGEVVNVGLGQHGIVLKFRLPERRSISSDDDELGLSRSQGFQC